MKSRPTRNAALTARNNVWKYVAAGQKQKRCFNFVKPPKDGCLTNCKQQDELGVSSGDAIPHQYVDVTTAEHAYIKFRITFLLFLCISHSPQMFPNTLQLNSKITHITDLILILLFIKITEPNRKEKPWIVTGQYMIIGRVRAMHHIIGKRPIHLFQNLEQKLYLSIETSNESQRLTLHNKQ